MDVWVWQDAVDGDYYGIGTRYTQGDEKLMHLLAMLFVDQLDDLFSKDIREAVTSTPRCLHVTAELIGD